MGLRLTFILGGARSGKSSYAQQLAAKNGGQVLFVATAEAGDAEMQTRIKAHQAERPAQWATLEAPLNVGAAVAAWPGPADVILIDCLTLLAGNVIAPLPESATELEATEALMAEVKGLMAAYRTRSAEWIIISNEVGLGVVPAYPLGRTYRDALGRANQFLAAAADQVLFMVAGLPLTLK